MDACGSRRLFYQRFVWLCQHAGITAILSFGSVNANISPIDLLLGYPANVILTWENRKIWIRKCISVGSPGTGRQYSQSISAEKCGCQSDQAGIWNGSSRIGCGDAFQRVQQKTCTFLPAGAGDHRCGSRGFCAVSLVWALCWPLTSIA